MLKKLISRPAGMLVGLYDLVQQERHLSKSRYMEHELKHAKATDIIRNHVGFSMGAALVPFPGADLVAVSAVHLNMLRQLAKLYNVGFIDSLSKNIISAVAGSGVARLAASLIKIIPGVGTVIGELSMPALAGTATWALGRVVANHFDNGGTLHDFDFKSARRRYRQAMKEGKKVASEMTPSSDETIEKLKQLAGMRKSGLLSEEEFQDLKERLMARL